MGACANRRRLGARFISVFAFPPRLYVWAFERQSRGDWLNKIKRIWIRVSWDFFPSVLRLMNNDPLIFQVNKIVLDIEVFSGYRYWIKFLLRRHQNSIILYENMKLDAKVFHRLYLPDKISYYVDSIADWFTWNKVFLFTFRSIKWMRR